ncbi:hypothetical protein GDO81_004325 [Engystomops pustulosus]|uniref:Uncharacterized protein n=1 Tax=Engystomops pustulosus TaxID=76066 RepID=A0AAV6ZTU2_ENGPU|nr:hypothetical protein GDO81_004325 [Engystomops pustulosus]
MCVSLLGTCAVYPSFQDTSGTPLFVFRLVKSRIYFTSVIMFRLTDTAGPTIGNMETHGMEAASLDLLSLNPVSRVN